MRSCVSAGEVAACGADVGHEERVAHEHRITKAVGHTGRCGAGHLDHAAVQLTEFDDIALAKQVIELRSVCVGARLQVEDAFEHLLHPRDVATDGDLPAELRSQVRLCRQVIGMGMGLQNPRHVQIVGAHPIEDPVGRCVARATGLQVVIEYRIDDGAEAARTAVNGIGHGPGAGIEQAVDFGAKGARGREGLCKKRRL